MTITYEVGDSLYINMTNSCSNQCTFCIRQNGDGAYGSDSLWLEREPTKEEVLADLEKRNLTRYDAIVFCGYGEPLSRLYDVLWVCKKLRTLTKLPIRVNTNGLANLMYNEDVTPLLQGLVDVVSISLNASNAESYDRLCHPKWGEQAYYAVLQFIRECRRKHLKVVATVVDVISPEEIEACRKLAQDMGVEYRVRHYVD